MVTAAENERTVVEVIADRFDVPVRRIEPGRVTVVRSPQASAAVRAFVHLDTGIGDQPSGDPADGHPAHDLVGDAGARAGSAPGAAGPPGGPSGGPPGGAAPGLAGTAGAGVGTTTAPGARAGAAGGNSAGGARVGDVLVMARPEHVELAERLLTDPATIEADLVELAASLGGRVIGMVARTGLIVPPPEAEVTLTTATDRRLPDWVIGHFTGPAWVVLSPDGRVLSTAVLKDYDERLREISVGTEAEARGRGLARSVVRAAARDVLANGRSVLYLHDLDNQASAAVAAAAGLQELGRLISVVGERRPS